MSNYDKHIVEAYLAGRATLDELAAEAGRMTIGYGAMTMFVTVLRMLERVEAKLDGKAE